MRQKVFTVLVQSLLLSIGIQLIVGYFTEGFGIWKFPNHGAPLLEMLLEQR